MAEKIAKSEEDWKKQLSPEQYVVTRKAGTEPAFTGKYWKTKEPGTYACVCCGQPLFSSETKFESGTGWPSFFKPIDQTAIAEETDNAYGMVRTEARCARCNAQSAFNGPYLSTSRSRLFSIARAIASCTVRYRWPARMRA